MPLLTRTDPFAAAAEITGLGNIAGDSDIVPTDSGPMFTALRVLGREVDPVRFHGETDGVGSRPAVSHTLDAVMLE